MTAGNMNDRLRFEAPFSSQDGYGGTLTGWSHRATVAARLTYARAGEAVMAARLAGRNVVIARVRRSSSSLAITEDWRAVDTRTGTIYAVRSIVPTADRAFLDVTLESGVQP